MKHRSKKYVLNVYSSVERPKSRSEINKQTSLQLLGMFLATRVNRPPRLLQWAAAKYA